MAYRQTNTYTLHDYHSADCTLYTVLVTFLINFVPHYIMLHVIFYTPCLKKLCKLIFCQNFVKFRPIVKIFDT